MKIYPHYRDFFAKSKGILLLQLVPARAKAIGFVKKWKFHAPLFFCYDACIELRAC